MYEAELTVRPRSSVDLPGHAPQGVVQRLCAGARGLCGFVDLFNPRRGQRGAGRRVPLEGEISTGEMAECGRVLSEAGAGSGSACLFSALLGRWSAGWTERHRQPGLSSLRSDSLTAPPLCLCAPGASLSQIRTPNLATAGLKPD